MSDEKLLIVGRALDPEESSATLQMLDSFDWPNATKCVVTIGKLDSRTVAKTVNVEAGYPADPAHLQTLAAWAECPHREDARFRDGYDLFCLRRVLEREHGFDYALLVRDASGLMERWPDLLSRIEDRPFLTLSSNENVGALLLNLRDERAPEFLDCAWELYLSGTVYALPTYSFDEALSAAHQAVRWAQDMDNPSSSSITR